MKSNQAGRRDYVLWFTGDSAMDLGEGIQALAVPLLALAVSGSPATAGAVGAAQAVGSVLTVLPGGVLADRVDRRRVVAAGSVAIVLSSATIAGLAATAGLTSLLLGILLVMIGLSAGFVTPANGALLKSIVSRPNLGSAMSVNQGRDAVVGLASGPLGGFLYGVAIWLPAALLSLLALSRAFLIMFVTRSSAPAAPPTNRPVLSDVLFGFRFVLKDRVLRPLALIAAGVNFAGGGIVVALVLDLRLQGAQPATIGVLFTVMAVGVLVGAPLGAWAVRAFPTGHVLIVGFAVELAGLVCAALSSSLVPVLASIAIVFVAMPAINSGAAGYLAAAIPVGLQGRAGAAVGMLSLCAAPLGTLLAGFGLEYCNKMVTVLAFSVVFAAALVCAIVNPHVRTIPRPDTWKEAVLEERET